MDSAVRQRPPSRPSPPAGTPSRRAAAWQWRPLLRALHRDVGYVAVGLTVIYAVSGLAVNHIQDWDPNFHQFRKEHRLPAPLPAEPRAAATAATAALGLRAEPLSITAAAADQVTVRLPDRLLHVNPVTGRVVEEGQRSRFFLRLANWLHLNRGKKAWTLVADLYAVALLGLALSGLFMLPGRNGLLGRGGVLLLAGIAVPALYVILSGGPPPPSRPGTAPPPAAVPAAQAPAPQAPAPQAPGP